MCVIIACENKFPSKNTIVSAEQANGHGGGIAWINKDHKVEFKKE